MVYAKPEALLLFFLPVTLSRALDPEPHCVNTRVDRMGDDLAELKAEVKRLHAKLQKVEGKTALPASSKIQHAE